jgi:hypothetical protein
VRRGEAEHHHGGGRAGGRLLKVSNGEVLGGTEPHWYESS